LYLNNINSYDTFYYSKKVLINIIKNQSSKLEQNFANLYNSSLHKVSQARGVREGLAMCD